MKYIIAALIALLICSQGATTWATTDDFNRANSGDVGANWDSGYTGDGALQIVGNRVRETTATDSTEIYNAVTLTSNQWASFTLATSSGAGVRAPSLLLRFAAPATKSGYQFGILVNGYATSVIRKWTAGSNVDLTSENATAWAAGDVMRVEVNGTTLKLYRNGTLLLSTTDGTYADGKSGIMIYSATVADTEVDDFNTGNMCTSSLLLMGVGGC